MATKQEVYDQYLAQSETRNEGREPTIVGLQETQELRALGTRMNEMGRFFQGGILEGIYRLPYGGVLEAKLDPSFGIVNKGAVWDDIESWRNYRIPMSPKTYFEEW